MQLSVTRGHRRPATSAIGVLAVLGFGAGITTGFLLGSLFGGGGPLRVGRLVRGASRSRIAPERRITVVDRVQAALAADPALRSVSFQVLPVGRRALELHGWVASRSLRTRAQRIALAAAGPAVTLVSRLLVRGEDDAPATLVPDGAPRSA